jgi:uncharacterized protein YdhG (YjbR/CyaY superfamily)
MAEKKPATKSTKTSATITAGKGKAGGFTDDERAAMKARAAELKAEERASKNRAVGEKDALAAIAKMKEPDRAIAKRLHAVIQKNAPDLWAKTWYGMPAYARDGKVVCFFRDRAKFKERYAMFGFNDTASLDDGAMWPVAFAITKLTAADEAKIGALVKQAVG